MEVPEYLKIYYESGEIFIWKIHHGTETAALHLTVDSWKTLMSKFDRIGKFLVKNKDSLTEILGGEKLDSIRKMYTNSRSGLSDQIHNGQNEIEAITFDMWKKLNGLVPEKLAERLVNNQELVNNQDWLFSMIRFKYKISPPQDLSDKSQVMTYFTDALEKITPEDLAETSRFKHLIIEPTREQMLEADRELFSIISGKKEAILSSINSSEKEIYSTIGEAIDNESFITYPKLKMNWWYLTRGSNYIQSVNPMYLYAVCVLVLLLAATPFVFYKYRAHVSVKLPTVRNKGMSRVIKAQPQANPDPTLMI